MSSQTNYIAYYRVSTQKQGASGLGLDAQVKQVTDFAARTGGFITASYTEVESGKKSDRVQILAAIAEAKNCLLYTSPSPRDGLLSRMPSSA